MRKQLKTPSPLPSAGERRRLREQAGLAGTSLAAQIGVSPATVYGWENGREPRGLLREVYAEALEQLTARTESEASDAAVASPDDL
jgi:transcriptional regulator with XRE-family HTH domain